MTKTVAFNSIAHHEITPINDDPTSNPPTKEQDNNKLS